MIFGCYFTRYKQLEFWEEMENRIHVRQYTWNTFCLHCYQQ